MWGDKLQSIIEPSYGIRLIKTKKRIKQEWILENIKIRHTCIYLFKKLGLLLKTIR